jgi:hypothetical protein
VQYPFVAGRVLAVHKAASRLRDVSDRFAEQPPGAGRALAASDGGGDHFMLAAAASWRQAFRLREPVDSSRRSAKPMRIALSSFLRRAALRVDSSGGQLGRQVWAARQQAALRHWIKALRPSPGAGATLVGPSFPSGRTIANRPDGHFGRFAVLSNGCGYEPA